MTRFKCIALTLMTAGFAVPAGAVTVIMPASYIDSGIYYNPDSINIHVLGEVAHTSNLGTASAAAYATPVPHIAVSGSTEALGTSVIANSYMTYSFLIASSGSGYANVLITTNAGATGSGSYFAESEVDLIEHNTTLAYAHSCHNIGYCNNVYTSGGTSSTWLKLNQFYTFRLSADGHTTNAHSEFSAFADPTVVFNPAYTHPADATIAYSPGFSPSAAVPEPASWALLLAGFGMIGAMARRGRRTRVGLIPTIVKPDSRERFPRAG